MTRHGKIAEHKTRTKLTIDKELKEIIQKEAAEEGKSLNAYILDAIDFYRNSKKTEN